MKSDGWGRLGDEFAREARRRGARSFGLGVGLLPCFAVLDQRGVVQELLGALSMGYAPALPALAYLELLAFISLGVAAARVMAWQQQRVEVIVFGLAAALLLVVYAVVTGAWLVGALAGFLLLTGVSETLAGITAAAPR
ncbi:MAG: hypothetical protein H6713_34490 [Myxococcales bacterium]|nr:hypothetical protein [Myxococcales bacterium]MCB9755074.1 hypothetical protein [Myxococcales bacterium]